MRCDTDSWNCMQGRGWGMRVLTWNVDRATPRSRRTPGIQRRIERHRPEIVCLTEVHTDFVGSDGYAICSQADYGYGPKGGQRKVMLWSREPWEQVDCVGADALPPGRFVSGVTLTSLGEVAVIGVCIPWSHAGVKAKRKKPWEEHERFLAGLARVLAGHSAERLIVLGDFNQLLGPGSKAPPRLQSALKEAFSPNVRIATAGIVRKGRLGVDHIALSRNLLAGARHSVSNIHAGKRLSDHFGVAVESSARPPESACESGCG